MGSSHERGRSAGQTEVLFMNRTTHISRLGALALAGSIFALGACSEDGGDVTTPGDGEGVGSLLVGVNATGPGDPNGFSVILSDGETTVAGPTAVGGSGAPATITLDGVPAGTYQLALTDVEGNCTVSENPREVTVVAGTTVSAGFAVTCS
jgi:hypothetical protein